LPSLIHGQPAEANGGNSLRQSSGQGFGEEARFSLARGQGEKSKDRLGSQCLLFDNHKHTGDVPRQVLPRHLLKVGVEFRAPTVKSLAVMTGVQKF
jgi:hypothetical protein